MTTSELLAGVDIWAESSAASEFDLKSIREDAIKLFDMLNKIGREKVYEYITDLTQIPKYTDPDDN